MKNVNHQMTELTLSELHQAERDQYLFWFPGIGEEGHATDSKSYKEERRTTPLYGLLGMHVGDHEHIDTKEPIFMNTNAPGSTFICGSQGGGKSYTLAAILENCVSKQHTPGQLINPLTGLIFHYDRDGAGTTAEAAKLCKLEDVKVRVLVSRSSYHTLKPAYLGLKGAKEGKMSVEPLLFQDHQLEIDRILKLMAFSDSDTAMPLYMEVVMRLLRETAISGQTVNLKKLEAELELQKFAESQKVMLKMRLGLLKSFCASSAKDAARKNPFNQPPISDRDVFTLEPGTLTIVDLSDPFVDASMACTLFDICLGLMTANKSASGMVITLDEAHKFMNSSPAAEAFTDRILTTIRMQRHYGARVVVATQEPTISERLLDLCSVSIVHRFTSPAWFSAIKDHLGGASSLTQSAEEQRAMFERILRLRVGESLVFSPSSFVCVEDGVPKKLGPGVMKMKTRVVNAEGGESLLSVERQTS